MVAAWEEHKNNRMILALDGEGPITSAVVGGLVHEMTGEVMISLPPREYFFVVFFLRS